MGRNLSIVRPVSELETWAFVLRIHVVCRCILFHWRAIGR